MAEGTTLAKAYVQIMPSAEGIGGKLSSLLGGEASSAGDNAGKSLGASLVGALKGVIVAAGIGKVIKDAISAGGELEQSVGGVRKIFGTGAAESVQEYAKQVGKSVGEVKNEFDTLNSSQNQMIENAKNAYKTAGMSANDYMQTATSFGASLLQGLGGDTQAAVDKTDMAIQDMSDNVNTFGTNQEDVLNAYKGFAKQNYTMLDNLKLGYGGTKAEMQRLLVDAQKLTGVKYDINNLGDVYDAIHAIQQQTGITGTTTREAASTFEGSTAMMKASWQNFLGDLSTGQNIEQDMQALTNSVGLFLNNLLRLAGNVLQGLPTVIMTAVSGISAALPQITATAVSFVASFGSAIASADWMGVGTTIMTTLKDSMTAMSATIFADGAGVIESFISSCSAQLPGIIAIGTEIITNIISGLSGALTTLIPLAGTIIASLASGILSNLPNILQAGTQIVSSLASGINSVVNTIASTAGTLVSSLVSSIIANLPQIVTSGAQLIGQLVVGILSVSGNLVLAAGKLMLSLVKTILTHLPDLLAAGITLIGELVSGIISAIPKVITCAKNLAQKIIETFKNTDWLALGKHIVEGIANGLKNAASKIVDAAKDAAKKALESAKKALGIHSPSRVMADQVGKFIPSGIALGIKNNTQAVTDAMAQLSEEAAGTIKTDLFSDITADLDKTAMATKTDTTDVTDKLEDMMSLLTQYMPALAKRQLVLDTGAVVGELASPMDRALGEIQRLKARL